MKITAPRILRLRKGAWHTGKTVRTRRRYRRTLENFSGRKHENQTMSLQERRYAKKTAYKLVARTVSMLWMRVHKIQQRLLP